MGIVKKIMTVATGFLITHTVMGATFKNPVKVSADVNFEKLAQVLIESGLYDKKNASYFVESLSALEAKEMLSTLKSEKLILSKGPIEW